MMWVCLFRWQAWFPVPSLCVLCPTHKLMVPGPSVSLLWQTLELGALQEASSPPRTLLLLFKSHLSNSSLLMGLPIVILSLENLQGAYQSEGSECALSADAGGDWVSPLPSWGNSCEAGLVLAHLQPRALAPFWEPHSSGVINVTSKSWSPQRRGSCELAEPRGAHGGVTLQWGHHWGW